MPYPVIMNGDHAEFEAEWAASGRPDHERPDWPLPSFDAQDWAAAFCKIANGFGFKDAEGKPIDEGWMVGWFANALMRGYDERAAEDRLAKRPVAFRIKDYADGWIIFQDEEAAYKEAERTDAAVQGLYVREYNRQASPGRK